MPIFWPPRSTMVEAWTASGALAALSAELAPKRTLALRAGVLQLPLRSRSRKFLRPVSPLSNSWLPRVKASKQTVFIMAASASPSAPARLKYRVPVRASPACSLSTLGARLESSSIAAVTRGKPPASTATATGAEPPVESCRVLDFDSSVEWWSLTCRMVSSIGSPPPDPPPQAAASAAAATAAARHARQRTFFPLLLHTSAIMALSLLLVTKVRILAARRDRTMNGGGGAGGLGTICRRVWWRRRTGAGWPECRHTPAVAAIFRTPWPRFLLLPRPILPPLSGIPGLPPSSARWTWCC